MIKTITQIPKAVNPRGAESLPPGIVEPFSDFYLRRLHGDPSEVWGSSEIFSATKQVTRANMMMGFCFFTLGL